MEVMFHVGAHGTEEDRLMKTLLRNRDAFLAHGTHVPGPAKYRELLRDSILATQSGQPAADRRRVLLDAILDQEQTKRVVLSNAHFFGSHRSAIDGQRLYPEADGRLMALRAMFPTEPISLCMAIRSPSGFLPHIAEKLGPGRRQTLLRETDPADLRWSSFFSRIRALIPELEITVWCYEDLPILWPELIRLFGNLPDGHKLKGGLDVISSVMSREGSQSLRKYLQAKPQLSDPLKRKVFAAFLDKFAVDDELEEELDMPGWTLDYIDQLDALYDADLETLQTIPGLKLYCA